MILSQMGSSLEPIILNTAKNEIRHQYLSADKARRVLDWRARYGLEAGLRETIAWYVDHLGRDESIARRAA
jgi:CDP-glucose 4,6-dehydratase